MSLMAHATFYNAAPQAAFFFLFNRARGETALWILHLPGSVTL